MTGPSDRDVRIYAARQSGRTIRDVAAEFGICPATVQTVERRVTRWTDAARTLQHDPFDIAAWCGVGVLSRSFAYQLKDRGAHKLTDLSTWTMRDLELLPGVGAKGRAVLLEMMRQAGIQLKPGHDRRIRPVSNDNRGRA